MPELRHLRIFVAVADELNFTRAAERLNLPQQTVSRTVQQLESELGVDVLERTTREVRLTAAGAELHEAGRVVVAGAEAAFARAREFGLGRAGVVKVGLTPAISPAEYDDVTRAVRNGADDLTVLRVQIGPDDVRRVLRRREVDLVVARTGDPTDGIDATALRPTPAILHVPATHPLAVAQSVSLSQLDGTRLLVWNRRGTPYTDLLLARLSGAGATVEPVEARVKGGAQDTELADVDAVALLPVGWPTSDGVVQVPLSDDLRLPLLVLSTAGMVSEAVKRVRAGMRADSE